MEESSYRLPFMSIQILKPDIIDQIAAGEVVERPSHMVKELVENALDAGAHRIEVSVEQGGRFVKVKDDGIGMSIDDLRLACARHATSKIVESDDLWHLQTFGFRGEALASIGAVSRLKIMSRRREDQVAHKVECDFGKLSEPMKSGTEFGTSVEVQNLLENVPARLKFLKSETAETTHIKTTMKAIALAHPEVEFIFHANGKLVFVYPKAQNLIKRAQDVLETKDVFLAHEERDGDSVEIVFASPNSTAKTSRQIWTFVQNRWVVDRTMQAAVNEAYRTLLMHGEYPIAIVKLQMPTEDVDVNIHPTKSQVKFVDQSRIFRLVHHTLRHALEQAPWIAAMKPQAKESPFASEARGVERSEVDSAENYPMMPTTSRNPLSRVYQETSQTLAFSGNDFSRTQYSTKAFTSSVGMEELQNAAAARERADEDFQSATVQEGFWSLLRVIGQSHLTYIIAESADALYLIDQHAAHERVMFEKLMEARKNKNIEMQNFLIPLALDVTTEQREVLLEQIEELENLGIVIESGGPETILVVSAPALVKERAVASVLIQFAEDVINKGGSFSIDRKLNDIFATMACHSAIRAGKAMSADEMSSLLQQMDQYKLSSYCPHGRNVYIQMTKSKIERDFGRIV